MIGDDPYTLGLFDTAGAFRLPVTIISPRLIRLVIFRSRGLRSSASTIIPSNRRLPRVL